MNNRLILGSGDWHWEGWTTVDANPANAPDFVAALPPLPDAVARQRWDTIMAIHFIEHIAVWEAESLLRDCYSILNDGGKIILEMPNIEYCAKVLLGLVQELPQDVSGEYAGQFSTWGFYGDPNHHDVLMLHRWGYSPRSITELLVKIGFKIGDIEVLPAIYHRPIRDMRIEARR